MNRLDDIGMICANTARTKAYLQALIQHEFVPNIVIVMQEENLSLLPGQRATDKSTSPYTEPLQIKELFGLRLDLDEPLENILNRAEIPHRYIDSTDINSEKIVRAITSRPEHVFIYSGFGGVILKDDILNTGKYFLHIHGGWLPDYKGSTTNYYSVLQEKFCGASSIFIVKEIDRGPVLIKKRFPPPEDASAFDYFYESALRADVLVETVAAYKKTGSWNFQQPQSEGGAIYFIMHPLLRHITLLSL